MAKGVILILAFEPEEMAGLGAVLRESGFEVKILGEVEPCLEILERADVVMALIDAKGGVREGLDLLAALRTMRDGLPVVLLGGECSSESIVEAYEKGANAFVAKPLNPALILAYVQRVLKGGR